MSNSFEDFVNNNLGIRMPLIEDNGHPHSSSKAAGILGSKYLDLNNNYLYEKTGEDNSSDWVKIASLGERRDVARGPNFSIQFNSGDVLAGNQYLTFLNNELSGVSGFFDELKVETIIADSMEVTGDLAVGGDFYASGEAFFGEEKPSLNRAVFSIQPSSLRGHNDAGQVRGGPQSSQANGNITIDITSTSPYFGKYSSLRMDFKKNGGSYSFSTSGNVLTINVPMLTGKGLSNARWYPNVGTVRDWLNTQVGVSAVLSSGVDPNKSGIQADGPGYIYPERAITKSIQSLGFHYDLVYSGEQLSGASGFFDDFKVSGDLAVGGNLYVSGETFIQSVTDVSVTGDISGYRLEGTSGVFDITTGASGIFDLTSGSSGDFDNLFVSGVSEITSGQFSEQLTISGMTVLTGVETGHFITTGETGIFVTTGQTGDFVTTGLTGDFVTTGETGSFINTGTVVEYISELKGSNSYSELEYNTSGDVTGLFTWSNDSQAYLVKTKKLTYNQSGLLTGVILTEGLLDVKLITELTYDSSGNLESIKKDYA